MFQALLTLFLDKPKKENMQSIKSEIKVQVKEKDHSYLCDANCNLLECFEAITHIRCYIAGRIQEEAEKQKACNEAPKEEPKPE